MRIRICGVVLGCLVFAGSMFAQQTDAFSRKNTWTVFAEYSNTSSHIVAGAARQRKLADLGFAYTRRVVRFWGTDLSYQIELRPVMFESDPLQITRYQFTPSGISSPSPASETQTTAVVSPCQPGSGKSIFPGETETYSTTCGRQWTFGEGFSPFGFKYSMRTRHKIQPFLIGTLGYTYTSRPVPVSDAESFNFLIDAGAGVEVFRSKTKSIAVECRVHHFSNWDTAQANPGTDNVMYKVSYSFGK